MPSQPGWEAGSGRSGMQALGWPQLRGIFLCGELSIKCLPENDFPFKISDLQKTELNSHTTIQIFNNKLKSINVKKFLNNKNEFGHAGFYWVKNNKIFDYIEEFIFKMSFNREILLDDYFKFLFDEKIYKVNYFMLDEYIHIGSIKEYLELKYWENYFKWEFIIS